MKIIRNFAIFGFLLSLIILISCQEKDDSPTGPGPVFPQELVGSWLCQTITVNDIEIPLYYAMEWQDGTESAHFIISDTGGYYYEELDSTQTALWFESGSVSVNGDSATISITNDSDGAVNPPEVNAGTWALQGAILAITTTVDSFVVVLYSIRE